MPVAPPHANGTAAPRAPPHVAAAPAAPPRASNNKEPAAPPHARWAPAAPPQAGGGTPVCHTLGGAHTIPATLRVTACVAVATSHTRAIPELAKWLVWRDQSSLARSARTQQCGCTPMRAAFRAHAAPPLWRATPQATCPCGPGIARLPHATALPHCVCMAQGLAAHASAAQWCVP